MELQTAIAAFTADVDVGHSSNSQISELVVVYTVEEAARILRIGRSLAYALARRYLATDGREGLPVLRVGNCLRVPAWALLELIRTGRTVRLIPANTPDADSADRTAGGTGSKRADHESSRRGRRRAGGAAGRTQTVEQLVLIHDE